MRIADLPKSVRPTPEPSARGLFEGELMDLYVTILIVVPLALFLKSLPVVRHRALHGELRALRSQRARLSLTGLRATP